MFGLGTRPQIRFPSGDEISHVAVELLTRSQTIYISVNYGLVMAEDRFDGVLLGIAQQHTQGVTEVSCVSCTRLHAV